ncbi:hypothetical protein HPB48_001440 [Haemaphysalis longicornis]|uniref:Neutral/alkaline non-lysosomal ceramidase N-terminal domain-containing protein n=1 Tax=Haemaphysalis longicornis TaxID=44386 RepID=A0A9J6FF13_HAELO|nr:hypothetical protein HPB48_001440 [Haemaphysalis longicornis]
MVKLGYAKTGQSSSGIHFRVYSRAFIIGDGASRVVIVNVDSGMIGDIVKMKVSLAVFLFTSALSGIGVSKRSIEVLATF